MIRSGCTLVSLIVFHPRGHAPGEIKICASSRSPCRLPRGVFKFNLPLKGLSYYIALPASEGRTSFAIICS